MKLIILSIISLITSSIFSQTCTSSGGDYDPDDYPHHFDCGYSKGRYEKNRKYEDYKLIENCGHYMDGRYYTYKGKVYYSIDYDTFTLLAAADTATFKCENGITKDKKNIYYKGKIVNNIDNKSFQSVGFVYCKDNKAVYYKNAYDTLETMVKIAEASSSSFTLIGDEYSHYAKDSTFVYYLGKALITSDPATFELLEYGYARDKTNAYYSGQIIEGMNGASFKVIKTSFVATDGVKLCSGTKVFENSDAATFEEIQCGYSRDKNNVYLNGRVLEGIDSKTFEILSWGFTKDKNAVYCDAQIIKGADPATFIVLGRKYSKDKSKVYYLQNTVDCDYDSFVVDNEKDYMAKDKNFSYKKGVRKL